MWKARPGLKRRFQRNRGGAALLVVVLILTGGATGWSSPVGAQGGTALLQLFPPDLSLARGEKTKVVAVARNPGAELRDVTLEVITGDGLVADPKSVELGTLAAGADRAQLFDLTSTGVLSSVPVRFLLKYNTGHDDRSRSNAVVTQLAVTERKPAQDDGLARVTLKTEVVEVSDRRGGDITVLTENTSAFPITVEEVSGYGPSHVTVCTPVSTSSTSTTAAVPAACKEGTASALQPKTRIEPRGVAVQTFTVRGVRRQITQGKQSVVFVARVTTQVDDPNLRRTDTLVADRTIDVKVFGESDLLTPLGIGSFLLLPGLLIVVVFLGLRARTTRAAAPAANGLGGAVGQKVGQLVNPEFWAWSIALSIGVVVLYSVVFDRDLRDGYDSDDLFKVWTGCVLLGVVAWAVIFSWVRWRHPVLSVKDDPTKVVAKLARLNSKLTFSQATVVQGATSTLGLVLGDLADGKVLLSPRIAYEFSSGPNRLRTWFRESVDGNDARAVRRRYLVMKLLPGSSVRLRWDAQGAWVSSSRAVDPATVTSGVPMKLLREQP